MALLEAQEIGWGASGRNGGQVLPGYAIAQNRPQASGGDRRMPAVSGDMSMEAVALVEQRIVAHAIPADYHKGYLYAAIRPRHERALEVEAAELAGLGLAGVEVLRGSAIQAHVASPRYRAVMTEPFSAHLHPLNYTLGLGRAAQAAGALIFSGHAGHVDRARSGCCGWRRRAARCRPARCCSRAAPISGGCGPRSPVT